MRPGHYQSCSIAAGAPCRSLSLNSGSAQSAHSSHPAWTRYLRQAPFYPPLPPPPPSLTCGMWFSTASIMTRCCWAGSGTCMRRAPPMAACGTSPSPACSAGGAGISSRHEKALQGWHQQQACACFAGLASAAGMCMLCVQMLPYKWHRARTALPVAEGTHRLFRWRCPQSPRGAAPRPPAGDSGRG